MWFVLKRFDKIRHVVPVQILSLWHREIQEFGFDLISY